jgi:hypothetical protein
MNLVRWNDLYDSGTYGPVPFETEVEAVDSFGTCTIPSRPRTPLGPTAGHIYVTLPPVSDRRLQHGDLLHVRRD